MFKRVGAAIKSKENYKYSVDQFVEITNFILFTLNKMQSEVNPFISVIHSTLQIITQYIYISFTLLYADDARYISLYSLDTAQLSHGDPPTDYHIMRAVLPTFSEVKLRTIPFGHKKSIFEFLEVP